MTVTDWTFTSADHAAITSAAKICTSRYRGYVEFQDVQQELYLWLLSHYDRAERWRAEHDEKHAERTLIKALRNVAEGYCRNEKAQKEGYAADDEFFYSIPMVADLLALSFDPDWMMPRSAELDASPSGKPASEGGNLMAMVADVTRALATLPDPDQRLLRRCYGHNAKTQEVIVELSLEWGITASAANSRIRRVVGRVRAALGGPTPYRKDDQ